MSRVIALLAVAVLLVAPFAVAPSVAPSSADGGRVAAHTLTPPESPGDGPNRSRRAETRVVEDAVIVNANPDELPPGCDEVAGERAVTIRAGRTYAEPGEMFGYDTDTVEVAPCTRLAVTLVNEDAVRHQWMVHGLPRETYPMGMFTIELTGPGKATAAFIVPSGDRTLRVHCSLPQHERKGMRARLVVGKGAGSERATAAARETTAGSQPGFGGPVAVVGIVLFALASGRWG